MRKFKNPMGASNLPREEIIQRRQLLSDYLHRQDGEAPQWILRYRTPAGDERK
jgi:hypothetical protein